MSRYAEAFWLGGLFYVCAILSLSSFFVSEGIPVPLGFWSQKELFFILAIVAGILGFILVYFASVTVSFLHLVWKFLLFPFKPKPVTPETKFWSYWEEPLLVAFRHLYVFVLWPIVKNFVCTGSCIREKQIFFISILVWGLAAFWSLIFQAIVEIRLSKGNGANGWYWLQVTTTVFIKVVILGLALCGAYWLENHRKYCSASVLFWIPVILVTVCWLVSLFARGVSFSFRLAPEKTDMMDLLKKLSFLILSVILASVFLSFPTFGKTILKVLGDGPKQVVFAVKDTNLPCCQKGKQIPCQGTVYLELSDSFLIKCSQESKKAVFLIPKRSFLWLKYQQEN